MFCDITQCYQQPEGIFCKLVLMRKLGAFFLAPVFDIKQMPPSASLHSTVPELFSNPGVVLLWNRTCHYAQISIKFHHIRAPTRRGWHKLTCIQLCIQPSCKRGKRDLKENAWNGEGICSLDFLPPKWPCHCACLTSGIGPVDWILTIL